MTDNVTVRVNADTAPLASALEDLQGLSKNFGTELTGALKSATVGGKALDDVLRRVGLSLAGMALNQGLKPLQSLTSTLLSGLLGGVSAPTAFAKGGVVSAPVIPFAAGGVVSSPTYFPLGGGLGLAGEAGAEAILPLRRSADGRLGVAAQAGAAPVNVVFNVTATDAGSFRKSQSQITGMLARAVSRGTATF